MAAHDGEAADTEGLRRLDEFKLAQLQRLAAQQARHAGPAGHAEDQAQRQQARIGTLGRGGEPFRMGIDDHLHHQYRGGDQQHAGNRTQGGVEVLDQVIDPAADIAGQYPKQHRQRQHHQRGQSADQEARAYALERQVEHVLADLVGAEDVIATRQRRHRAAQQQDRQQGMEHGVDGDAAGPSRPLQQEAQQPPERQADGGPEQHALGNVAAVRIEIRTQMCAAMLEARKIAARRIADRFLGVQMRRQRRGIGLFATQAKAGEQRVKRRGHLDGIAHRFAGLRIQARAVMQRIEQADDDERRQHRRRRHRHTIPEHPAPGRTQVVLAPRPEHQGANGHDQQEQQRIRPEHDDLETHCRRTLGSAMV